MHKSLRERDVTHRQSKGGVELGNPILINIPSHKSSNVIMARYDRERLIRDWLGTRCPAQVEIPVVHIVRWEYSDPMGRCVTASAKVIDDREIRSLQASLSATRDGGAQRATIILWEPVIPLPY